MVNNEEQLGEAEFDATRVARFLRAPDGSLRVAVVNITTGRELGSFPIVDRTREGMARVMEAVVEVRGKLTGRGAPSAAPAGGGVTIAALRDVYQGLLEHDRIANHLPETVVYQSPTFGEIAITRGALRAINLDDVFSRASAGRSGAAAEAAILRAIDDAAMAADPASSVAEFTFSPERWRGYGGANLVMRRTPRGIEVDAPSAAPVTQQPDVAAVAAANDAAQLQARLQVAYEAAVSEFMPDDGVNVDGAPTSNAILDGMPSFDEIAALVSAGRSAEAVQRVALIERRLDAARRGDSLESASRGAVLAPPGSFRAFVTAPAPPPPPPPPPPTPAGPFGAVPYEDSGRYFGTVVRVAAEGRTSPAWEAVVYNVRSNGDSVEVTSPQWKGRWTGDVPTVEIPSRRVEAVLRWHDAKGERGSPFDPYANRDMPESDEADRRVELLRLAMGVDLRAAPERPTTIVFYQGDGLFVAASGAPDPKLCVSVGALADAVLAAPYGSDGVAAAYRVTFNSTAGYIRDAVNRTRAKHAGGYWNSAELRMALVPNPEAVYRPAALAIAERISWWFEEHGFHRASWAHVTIAGPPFANGSPTYETYVPLRSRLEDALVREGLGREDARAWVTAGLVRDAITGGRFNAAMDPSNKAARRVFARFTGVTLPAGLKATQDVLNGRRTFTVVDHDDETVKLNGRRRAKRNSAVAARDESWDEMVTRDDGQTLLRRQHRRVPSAVTADHWQDARVARAGKVASTITSGYTRYVGQGNFGIAYTAEDGDERLIVKVPAAHNIHRQPWPRAQQTENIRHEAGVANELSALGYTIVPRGVYTEWGGGTPSFVREYGEPMTQITGPEYAAIEAQLTSIERDAGWRVHDMIEPYRRPDGTIFVADVGVWQAPSSPPERWSLRNSALSSLLEGLQQRLLPGLKTKQTRTPYPPESAYLARVPAPTLPDMIGMTESMANDARDLRQGGLTWHAGRRARRFIDGIAEREALGIGTPPDVRGAIPLAHEVMRLVEASGEDEDEDD